MKNSVIKSPANIAFVKYWGRRDDSLILPLNSSVSMNLSDCTTTTSCEWGEWDHDTIKIKYQGKEFAEAQGSVREKALAIVERVRKRIKTNMCVKIASENNFPAAAGIASSASGFSALTMALYESYGFELSEKELSIESRLSGSGSACRSIPGGFVLWEKGEKRDGSDSFAHSIAPADYWDLRDIVCVVDVTNKKVSSGEGHVRAKNEYMKARLLNIDKRVEEAAVAIKEKDLEKLGAVTEIEALSLHAVCMLSEPPIFYLSDGTFAIMQAVRGLRENGILAYYTMDAGANVHIIAEAHNIEVIVSRMKEMPEIKQIIVNSPCLGARVV